MIRDLKDIFEQLKDNNAVAKARIYEEVRSRGIAIDSDARFAASHNQLSKATEVSSVLSCVFRVSFFADVFSDIYVHSHSIYNNNNNNNNNNNDDDENYYNNNKTNEEGNTNYYFSYFIFW